MLVSPNNYQVTLQVSQVSLSTQQRQNISTRLTSIEQLVKWKVDGLPPFHRTTLGIRQSKRVDGIDNFVFVDVQLLPCDLTAFNYRPITNLPTNLQREKKIERKGKTNKTFQKLINPERWSQC